MAATNFTPIILYHSVTASAAPTAGNLNNGELAINITDGKLFYKDNGGVVQIIATKGTGVIGGSNNQVQYNSSGALAGSANFTFDGTTATINTLNLTTVLDETYGGTGLTSYTTGDVIYASGSNTLAKLAIGANTYILTSTGSVPQWSAPSAVSVSTATNLAGGTAGAVPYQSGVGATTFLSIGTSNQVLTSTGSAPQWVSGLSLTTLSTSGNTTLGDAAADNLTINATVTSNLIFTDNTYDIGANGATRPRTIYVGTSVFSPLVDTTNLEVTNIKALDGTAAASIANSTGVISISANPVLSGGTANGVLYLNASKSATSGTALVFDGSNLGVNITPNAWGANFRAIQVAPRAILFSDASVNNTVLANNYYNNGTNNVYQNSGFANALVQINGQHQWYTAPSGTANTTTITNGVSYTIITSGNQTAFGAANNNAGTVFTATSSGTLSSGTVSQNITFTESMTLDANGGLITKPVASGNSVFNENGVDADFRVESDANTHMLFVDASEEAVGIATTIYSGFGSLQSKASATAIRTDQDWSFATPAGNAHYMAVPTSGSSTQADWLILRGTYYGASLTHKTGIVLQDYYRDNNQYGGMYLQATGGVLDIGSITNGTYVTTNASLNPRVSLDATGGLVTKPAANGHAVFNEDGVDADFRVESDGSTHALFVDASANAVGIRYDTPLVPLQIGSFGSVSGMNETQLALTGASGFNAAAMVFNSSNTNYAAQFYFDPATGNINYRTTTNASTVTTHHVLAVGGAVTFNESGADADFRVESDTNAYRLFIDAGNDTVLMGTTTNTNSSKLVVDGSISETVGGVQYQVVSQADIGTAPNEIPLNQYLGTMAYQDGTNYFNTGMTVGFRNRIINGAMQIDQRNAGASIAVPANTTTYITDRWQAYMLSGTCTAQQVADAPANFGYSLKATTTSASSGAVWLFQQRIEGLNCADLGFGTSTAKTVTLSFWVKSSVTGLFAGGLENGSLDRSFVFTYTINAASTWEYKTVTISGDTTGSWDTGTSTGLKVAFSFGGGGNTITPGVWTTADSIRTASAVGIEGTAGATWQVTGVQLEVGTQATPFDWRPYTTEFQLCQRYFEKSIADGTAATATTNPAPTLVAAAFSTTAARTQVFYKTPKRATPTLTTIPSSTVGTGNQWGWFNGAWNGGATTVAQQNANAFSIDIAGTYTQFYSYIIDGNWYASAEL